MKFIDKILRISFLKKDNLIKILILADDLRVVVFSVFERVLSALKFMKIKVVSYFVSFIKKNKAH